MNARLCQVCDKPEDEHVDTRHMFTPQGTRVDTTQFARKRPKGDDEGDDKGATRRIPMGYTQTPFDPVLRQALIDKGVLTIEDLEIAQRKIGIMTNQVTGGHSGGTKRAGS